MGELCNRLRVRQGHQKQDDYITLPESSNSILDTSSGGSTQQTTQQSQDQVEMHVFTLYVLDILLKKDELPRAFLVDLQ